MSASGPVANKFYDAGESRAEKVNDLFATIAPRYDLINDLQSFGLHRLWKRRLVQLSRVKRGETALDLCCGTGDVAFALAAAGAHVTGLDFSAPMLHVAGQRKASIARSGRAPDFSTSSPEGGEGRGEEAPWLSAQLPSPQPSPRLGGARESGAVSGSDQSNLAPTPARAFPAPHFLQGDALRIPFPDAHFDIVTISYGLRNLANFDGGLREMWRVAKPGGRLLVLDFGKPDNALWRSLYFTYLRSVVPVFGKIFCGDSATHAYILESLKHYPAQRGVAGTMKELGCANVRIINLLGGMMSLNYGEKV